MATIRMFNALGEVGVIPSAPGFGRARYRCRKGCGAGTANGYTANALVPDSLTDIGGGACFNDARVQVERATSVARAKASGSRQAGRKGPDVW